VLFLESLGIPPEPSLGATTGFQPLEVGSPVFEGFGTLKRKGAGSCWLEPFCGRGPLGAADLVPFAAVPASGVQRASSYDAFIRCCAPRT
jgi:hypothetical protein